MIRHEWRTITRNRLCQVLLLSVILLAVFLSYLAIENSIDSDEDYDKGYSLASVRQLVEKKINAKASLHLRKSGEL